MADLLWTVRRRPCQPLGVHELMSWQPINCADMEALISRELADCSPEMRGFFDQVRISPVKWRQSPWGDEGGGFWAIAVCEDRVLWYNDIEDGFNVSRFANEGEIPKDEYWCNQDELRWALPRLRREVRVNPTA